jgi:hypothetical protein
VIAVPRPAAGDHAPQAAGYVARAPRLSDALAELALQRDAFAAAMAPLSEERAGYRYAPDKWSIKELVGHLSDSERILSYRMLRIGRGDATPIPGFEEDDYVRGAHTGRRRMRDVLAEWVLVRQATEALVRGMPHEAWQHRGIANNHAVTTAALLHIIVGHVEHHRQILRERYGSPDS